MPPSSPTLFAVRGDQYKYIRVQGLWDIDELYDLKADPMEQNNLIFSPEHKDIAKSMNKRLWEIMEEKGAMAMPLQPDHGGMQNRRRKSGSKAAGFQPDLVDDI